MRSVIEEYFSYRVKQEVLLLFLRTISVHGSVTYSNPRDGHALNVVPDKEYQCWITVSECW